MVEAEKRPSKKQRELLSFIDGFIKGHGYGPSYREVMRALDYKSVSTVAVHIDNLIAKGHLHKKTNSARTLEVVKPSHNNTSEASGDSTTWQAELQQQVEQHFAAYEASPTKKQLDELYVLVGAMHILKMQYPARKYKDRLKRLTSDAA